MATKMTGPGKKPKLNAPGNTAEQNKTAYFDKQKRIDRTGKIIGGAVTLGTVAGTAAALLSNPENRAAVKKGLKKVGGAIKQGATAVRNSLRPKGDWVSDPNDSSKMIREKSPSRRAVPRPK